MDRKTRKLFRAAQEARKNAHAPYSGFRVGAALLAEGGEVFRGANVENSSLGLTVCAERAAACAAVSAGRMRFEALLVLVDAAAPMAPCGACLQFLSEFGPDMEIIMATASGLTDSARLRDLIRAPFGFPPIQFARNQGF